MSTHPNTPFYCGTQRLDWKCYNCDFCTKRYTDEDKWRCDLEKAIDSSFMDDGSVSDETARRMGLPEDCRVYNWRCPEFVEDAAERARVLELVKMCEAEKKGYQNRNRPAPWMEEWLAKKQAQTTT